MNTNTAPGDILIIEDDQDICEVYKEYLKPMKFFRNIIFAHDGIMAIKRLNNQKFSLIILDINLPKIGGIELIDIINQSPGNSLKKVIIISGNIDRDLLTVGLTKGIKYYLIKPFEKDDLISKVREII